MTVYEGDVEVLNCSNPESKMGQKQYIRAFIILSAVVSRFDCNGTECRSFDDHLYSAIKLPECCHFCRQSFQHKLFAVCCPFRSV